MAVKQRLPAEGLMGVEVVSQQGVVAARILRAARPEPAFGGVDLAVLFFGAVLGNDELGLQGNDARLVRADDDRGDGGVKMGGRAVGVRLVGTVRAMDVVRLGGEVMGAVQGDHLGVVEGGLSHGLKQTALLGDPIHFIEHVKQTLGLDRVEHVADVTVARDVFDAEEGLRVVGTAPGLHVPLPLKKGRTLGRRPSNTSPRTIDPLP